MFFILYHEKLLNDNTFLIYILIIDNNMMYEYDTYYDEVTEVCG